MSVLDELRRLSSAEEFFAFLNAPYNPAALNPARLHILRRMGEYLRKEPLDGRSDDETRATCRAYLEQAYSDFTASSPLEQRVFKVLKDAAKPVRRNKPEFVALITLTRRDGT